jgi:hypothetical protein
VEALSHLFRLDVDDPSTSEDPTPGPSVELVVPPSPSKFSWKTPRGYLTTLIGASAGGAVGEILILLGAKAPADKDCGADVGCAFDNVIGAAIFLLFAILAGLLLLWIGSFVGAWMGLRIRSYLGSKTTALSWPSSWCHGRSRCSGFSRRSRTISWCSSSSRPSCSRPYPGYLPAARSC